MGRRKKEKNIKKEIVKKEIVEDDELEEEEMSEEENTLYIRNLRKKYRILKKPSERSILVQAKKNPDGHWCDVFKKCREAWGEWTLPFDKKKIKNMNKCKLCLTLKQEAGSIKWLYQYDKEGWKELQKPDNRGRKKKKVDQTI